jgi:hypothetical protein
MPEHRRTPGGAAPRRLGAAALLAVLGSLAAGRVEARVILAGGVELGGGYDSNLYLDALAFAATVGNRGGGLFRIAPTLELLLRSEGGHLLSATCDVDYREVFFEGGEHESRVEHGAELLYRAPPLLGFLVSASAGFEQLHFRLLEEGGWIGPHGGIQLGRTVGPILRLAIGYTAEYLAYSSANGSGATISMPSWELYHRLQGSLALRLLAGLLLEAKYTGSLVQASRSELGSTRHEPLVGLAFAPIRVPLELRAAYGLQILLTQSLTANPAGKTTAASRLDTVHEAIGEARFKPLRWLELFARYAGLFGSSTVVGDYARHVVLLGVDLSLERDLLRAAPRPRAPTVLELRVEAPGASRVAVVGSFNSWDPSRDALAPDPSHPGAWVGRVQLPPGRHQYLLWVDGALRPPPDCESFAPDGFGGRSCTIVGGD